VCVCVCVCVYKALPAACLTYFHPRRTSVVRACVYLATDELKSTMDAEHRKQMTELEQNLADAKRQHTKTGLELLFCCICDKIL